ncbi:MAG: cysteine desulfurase-like protein [Pseudaminobacter sp.]|nr:cysteine desulfurase-like protein [Pseudaminobacter sp.]
MTPFDLSAGNGAPDLPKPAPVRSNGALFEIDAVRAAFPALSKNPSRVYFDNPAGTQISGRSLAGMVDAMTDANANLGGFFETSGRAEELVENARATAAAFLNANSADEIVFGQSMTALTFAMARAVGSRLHPGDAILLTRMDHDANVAPWLLLAEERDLEIRWLDFDPDACEFDLADLDRLIDSRLRLAAIGLASNVTGTVHDVKSIAGRVREAGGLTYVDAVQYAPHASIDVQALGCDFLVCSAYKFYGPHCAILWGKQELLDDLPAHKVRPAADRGPGKWEAGTKSRELIAGIAGAIEHFAWIGDRFGDADHNTALQGRIKAGLQQADAYERALTAALIAGLLEFKSVRIHGLTHSQTLERRVPTVSFTTAEHDPDSIARAMAERNIQVWSGHNYGIEPVRRLGLDPAQGVLRVGLGHYNTRQEVEKFLTALAEVGVR